MTPRERDPERPGLALKIGIAGAIGLGAIVSGMLMSRRGRRLVKEAWEGRRRTRLEDRILDVLWGDPRIGHRNFDVEEIDDGTVALSGVVRDRREHALALRLARRVKDVTRVEDRLVVEPGPRRYRERRSRRRARE
ncbi:MAG: BON domain-containing protein [Gemmatimonadetes bacterium]|nr:BON domain-containing protein [Gemmatimonadota bacterium]